MAGGYLKIMLTVPKSANTKITFKPKLYEINIIYFIPSWKVIDKSFFTPSFLLSNLWGISNYFIFILFQIKLIKVRHF